MIILNSDYEAPFIFFDQLDKIEPLKMDDGTYTKKCFYYRDENKQVLVRINNETIKNIKLISNDNTTDEDSCIKSYIGNDALDRHIADVVARRNGTISPDEEKTYNTYETKYTILITLKNDKVILVGCNDQEKNELFFLKSKLTDKEVKVEETKIYSEIEKDFLRLIDKRNKLYKKLFISLSKIYYYANPNFGISLCIGIPFFVFFIFFIDSCTNDKMADFIFGNIYIDSILCFLFFVGIMHIKIYNKYYLKKLKTTKNNVFIKMTSNLYNKHFYDKHFGIELYFAQLSFKNSVWFDNEYALRNSVLVDNEYKFH